MGKKMQTLDNSEKTIEQEVVNKVTIRKNLTPK